MTSLLERFPFLTPQGVDLEQDAYRVSSSLRLFFALELQSFPRPSLPDNPIDNQLAYLELPTGDLTTDDLLWAFKYDADETSVYKWKFVGGPQLGDIVNAVEVPTANGVYQDLATVGPEVTVPLNGVYQLQFGCFMGQDSNSISVTMNAGIAIDATPPVDAESVAFGGRTSAGTTVGGSVFRGTGFVISTAPATLKIQYKVNTNAADTVFGQRSIAIIPVALEAA